MKLAIISLLTGATLGCLVNLASSPKIAASSSEKNKYLDEISYMEQLSQQREDQIIIVLILIIPIGISLGLTQISPLMSHPAPEVNSTQSTTFKQNQKIKEAENN